MVENPEPVFDDVPAKIENLRGDEEQRGLQVVAGATHLIETRFLNDLELLPGMIVTMPRYPPGSGAIRKFYVLRTVDPEFLRRRLHHYVKEEIAANG